MPAPPGPSVLSRPPEDLPPLKAVLTRDMIGRRDRQGVGLRCKTPLQHRSRASGSHVLPWILNPIFSAPNPCGTSPPAAAQ